MTEEVNGAACEVSETLRNILSLSGRPGTLTSIKRLENSARQACKAVTLDVPMSLEPDTSFARLRGVQWLT